jgi:uncharacterized C2H2 Zn-finger protein
MRGREKLIKRGTALQGEGGNVTKGKGQESGKKRKSTSSSAPVAVRCESGPNAHACPECGKSFRTDEAVQTHRHAAHGTAATVVGDMTRCTECGSLVKNSNMARHRRRKHGML